MFGIGTKLKENIFNNNQINSNVMSFVDRMVRNATYRIGTWMKKMMVAPVYYVVLQCVSVVPYWQRWRRWVPTFPSFSKRCWQCNFSEIFKGRSSSNYVGIRTISPNFSYDETKHYQVSFKKQGRCKVYKNNSWCHCVKYRVDLYMFWNILQILATVWLCNLRFENIWISSV